MRNSTSVIAAAIATNLRPSRCIGLTKVESMETDMRGLIAGSPRAYPTGQPLPTLRTAHAQGQASPVTVAPWIFIRR